jgi:t-SNARE complex subunit (syntaxin)
MNSLAVYSHPGLDSSATSDSGSGGGQVQDILERLGNVETDVSDLKSKVSAILATVPHLATKADVLDVRSAVAEMRADMENAVGSIRADMAARENAFMKWMIATVLAAGGLALTIAKFVH